MARLFAYDIQVLIGTSIIGCNISLDRTFDLPTSWNRLHKGGFIDRADGLASPTEKGDALIEAVIAAVKNWKEE